MSQESILSGAEFQSEMLVGAPELESSSELSVFDPAEYLDSEEMIAAYLNDCLEEGDSALIAQALGDVARARGMTEMAKDTGMAREALYKALRPNSSPRLETIMKVMKAVGLRLVVQPIGSENVS